MPGFAPGDRARLAVGLPNPADFGGRYKHVIPILIEILDVEGNEIGFIRELSFTIRRNAQVIRHLNYYDAGRNIEMAWTPQDAISVSANGVLLYTEDLLDPQTTLGRLAKQTGLPVIQILNTQRIPFSIVIDQVHPATGKGLRTLLRECVVTQYRYNYREGDAYVSDSVDCSCLFLEESSAVGYEPIPTPQ